MAFCDLPLADQLCAVGDAADFVSNPGGAIGNWMARSAGELAAAAADLAAAAADTTTKVDLNAEWFRANYELILPIGLVVLVATFCAQLVRAAIRRDGQALAQAFTGTAMGVLFAFSAIALTTVAVEVVDALSDGLFKAANSSLEDAVRRIVKVSQIAALTNLGWLVPTVTALGASIGAFLYWCVMMVRKVGILVLVTLAVFAGAGGGWEAARRWRRGWIEATATLVVSKLLMTIIFLLGISAIGETRATDGVGALSDVMAGIVVMALVLLCPYATFKFVHWAAEGTNGEDVHRAGGAGAVLVRQHAERAARKATATAATAGTGGAAAAAGAEVGAPQGPDTIPGGGGFPGDIAPTSTAGESRKSSQGGGAARPGPEKSVQSPPATATDGTGGQASGSPGTGGFGAGTTAGRTGGWQSTPPTTSPPPQGSPPSAGSRSSGTDGTASPPPPPTGR